MAKIRVRRRTSLIGGREEGVESRLSVHTRENGALVRCQGSGFLIELLWFRSRFCALEHVAHQVTALLLLGYPIDDGGHAGQSEKRRSQTCVRCYGRAV